MKRSSWLVASVLCAVTLGATSAAPRPISRASRPVAAFVQSPAAQAQWQDVIRNLRHPDVKVRLSAVNALGRAGYTAAAEYVAPLVTDPDDRVQFAAIDAELTFFLIEPIGGGRAISLTGSERSRAQEAFEAGPLVRAAAPAPLVLIDNLTTAMRDPNERIRFDAVHALGVIAEAPLPPAQAKALLDGLDHYDWKIRAATARVLGRLRVSDAGDTLIAGLNDSSPQVRQYCAEALGLIREERAVESLSRLVAYYGKNEMAGTMLLALARIAHPSSRDLLRAKLSDPNAAMRRAAAEGLGRLHDRDSLDALKAMTTADASRSVRLAATFAVGLMADPQAHVIASELASPAVEAQARDYLLELGPAAAEGVKAALGVATDARQRANLVHVLGFVGGRDAAPVIEPLVKDRDERVSRAAANAIARIARVAGGS